VRRRSEKYVVEGSKYAHWIGLYLSFQLNWVLAQFVHGKLQNLQTSEDTFAHVITPLSSVWISTEQSVMVSGIVYIFLGFVIHDWS